MLNIFSLLAYMALLISIGLATPIDTVISESTTDLAASFTTTAASAVATALINGTVENIENVPAAGNLSIVDTNQRSEFTNGRYGGFKSTCGLCYTGHNGYEYWLNCECDGPNGRGRTDINLSKCFENVIGFVAYKLEGDFYRTCPEAWLTPYTSLLNVNCKGISPQLVQNRLDLNRFIGNFDGRLDC